MTRNKRNKRNERNKRCTHENDETIERRTVEPARPFGYVDDAEASELSGVSQQTLLQTFLRSGRSGLHVVAHVPESKSINSYSTEFLYHTFPAVKWHNAASFTGPL